MYAHASVVRVHVMVTVYSRLIGHEEVLGPNLRKISGYSVVMCLSYMASAMLANRAAMQAANSFSIS